MADAMFDPVAGLIDPKTYEDISKQWSTFMDDPKGRAALLQTGIAMSQPLAWGQSNFGGLMSSIGSGGEAVGRVEAMDLKQQEADSKAALRDAQSMAAESRAGAAASKATNAEELLRIRREGIQQKAATDIRRGYETYRKNVEESNNQVRLLNPEAVKEPMSIENWIRSNPSAKAAAEASGLYGTTGVTAPGTYADPAATAPAATGQDAAARDWLRKNPNHPDAPAVRQKLLGL